MMLVLFFFLILILQTQHGYLHASENCDSIELSFKEHLTCISKTNIPQMNAYAKCRLVGVHRDYTTAKSMYDSVYTDAKQFTRVFKRRPWRLRSR